MRTNPQDGVSPIPDSSYRQVTVYRPPDIVYVYTCKDITTVTPSEHHSQTNYTDFLFFFLSHHSAGRNK